MQGLIFVRHRLNTCQFVEHAVEKIPLKGLGRAWQNIRVAPRTKVIGNVLLIWEHGMEDMASKGNKFGKKGIVSFVAQGLKWDRGSTQTPPMSPGY